MSLKTTKSKSIAGSLGAEGESGQADGFEEGRCLVHEDAVDHTNNGAAQNGLVDQPELGHEVVDPLGRLGFVLELHNQSFTHSCVN